MPHNEAPIKKNSEHQSSVVSCSVNTLMHQVTLFKAEKLCIWDPPRLHPVCILGEINYNVSRALFWVLWVILKNHWTQRGHDGCCLVTKSEGTPDCDPLDCSPPGSSVHGILQARILEWVAISSSRGSSQSRDETHISCIGGGFFTTKQFGKPKGAIGSSELTPSK